MGLSNDELGDLIKSSIENMTRDIFQIKTELIEKIESIKKDMNTKYESLIAENNDLRSRITQMEDEFERKSRKNQLIVNGVPASQNDNPKEIFDKISSVIGYVASAPVNVFCKTKKTRDDKPTHMTRNRAKSDSQSALLNPKITAKSNTPLFIEFSNSWDKHHFWFKYLNFGGKLQLSEIGFNSDDRVFISENLTKVNYNIVRECSNLKRLKLIVNYYTKDGLCYIRKKSSDKSTLVKTMVELEKYS